MWEFIVLGDIPGTSVQVTFETWLYVVGVALCLAALIWCTRKRMLFAAWRIARVLRQEVKTTPGQTTRPGELQASLLLPA